MRKRKQKCKILFNVCTIIFAVMTCLCINVNAAVTITVDSLKHGTTDSNSFLVTNTSTLTVNGVVSTDKFKAYKILDAYYNQSRNTITYEFTTDFQNYLDSSEHDDLTIDDYFELTSGNITNGSTVSSSNLDTLVSGYASYIKKNSVSGSDMIVNGTSATITATAGAYLVLPSETTKVYAVMVGNLDFKADGSEWVLNTATIQAKVSDAGVEKSVGTLGYQEGSFTIGQEFSYYLVGTVPQYPTNATNRTYRIVDTMSKGLTFSGINSIQISDGETPLMVESDGRVTDDSNHTVATILVDGQKITINFDLTYVTSNKINISYKAKLNNNAVLGSAGNTNGATLEYANDPYGDGTYTTEVSSSNAFTYGIELFKFATDDRTPLSGAVFEIYSDSELLHKVGELTTESDGYGRFDGVSEGTYYLKEITAPTGYSLLRDTVTVNVGPLQEEAVASDTEGYYTIEVGNAEVGLLPFTGGTGTIIYSIVGLLVVGGAFWFLIVYRKKNKGLQAIN